MKANVSRLCCRCGFKNEKLIEMKRPKKEDFKVKYNKGDAELCSVTKQYSKAQDEYIDYLEQLTIPDVVGQSEQLGEGKIRCNSCHKIVDKDYCSFLNCRLKA